MSLAILNFKQNNHRGWTNIQYINAAAAIWILITLWLCKIYTPHPFSDDFLLYAIGLLGSGAFAMIFYLHIKPYSIQKEQNPLTPNRINIPQDHHVFLDPKFKDIGIYEPILGIEILDYCSTHTGKWIKTLHRITAIEDPEGKIVIFNTSLVIYSKKSSRD